MGIVMTDYNVTMGRYQNFHLAPIDKRAQLKVELGRENLATLKTRALFIKEKYKELITRMDKLELELNQLKSKAK